MGGYGQPHRPPGPFSYAFLAQIHESSPLDLASEEPERLPCLQRLLDLGADVNAADKHGGCLPQESRAPGTGCFARESQSTPGQWLGVQARFCCILLTCRSFQEVVQPLAPRQPLEVCLQEEVGHACGQILRQS